jgi:hypothetical protein
MSRPSPRGKLRALRAVRRRLPPRVLLLWALGAVLILASAFALSDPALVMFALDPELVALLVLSSLALLRASPAVAFARGFAASAARAVRRRAGERL